MCLLFCVVFAVLFLFFSVMDRESDLNIQIKKKKKLDS